MAQVKNVADAAGLLDGVTCGVRDNVRRREERAGVDVALQGYAAAEALAQRGQVLAPVDAEHAGAGGGQQIEEMARVFREEDHGCVAGRKFRDQ